MIRDPNAYAKRLEAAISLEARRELASSPLTAMRAAGILVSAVPSSDATDACSCDGAYFHDQRAICYVATPRSRRENFTVLHEFGHHLVMSDDEMLSELADADAEGGVAVEERICDAFAGRILIPDGAVVAVLGGRRPRAADVRALYDATAGSMEACAVRLAERIGCEGYVALLDRQRRELRFASPSAEFNYGWRRGTALPADHPAWQAGADGTYVGEGDVVWTSRSRKRFWLDAIGAGGIVIAIFSADCYWPHAGLTILDEPGVRPAGPQGYSGICRHCGGPAWGMRACEVCGDARCRVCGRCGCGAPAPAIKICTKCHFSKGKAQFRAGQSVCRECDEA